MKKTVPENDHAILATLRELMSSGRPIGFSPWRDGHGTVWGYLRGVSESSLTVEKISPVGAREEVESFDFADISYFDTDPIYAERLTRLADYSPTWPEEPTVVSKRKAIRRALEEALESREILRGKFRGMAHILTVQVAAVEGDWVWFVDFDDNMAVRNRLVFRVDMVKEIRLRSASIEADLFLLAGDANR